MFKFKTAIIIWMCSSAVFALDPPSGWTSECWPAMSNSPRAVFSGEVYYCTSTTSFWEEAQVEVISNPTYKVVWQVDLYNALRERQYVQLGDQSVPFSPDTIPYFYRTSTDTNGVTLYESGYDWLVKVKSYLATSVTFWVLSDDRFVSGGKLDEYFKTNALNYTNETWESGCSEDTFTTNSYNTVPAMWYDTGTFVYVISGLGDTNWVGPTNWMYETWPRAMASEGEWDTCKTALSYMKWSAKSPDVSDHRSSWGVAWPNPPDSLYISETSTNWFSDFTEPEFPTVCVDYAESYETFATNSSHVYLQVSSEIESLIRMGASEFLSVYLVEERQHSYSITIEGGTDPVSWSADLYAKPVFDAASWYSESTITAYGQAWSYGCGTARGPTTGVVTNVVCQLYEHPASRAYSRVDESLPWSDTNDVVVAWLPDRLTVPPSSSDIEDITNDTGFGYDYYSRYRFKGLTATFKWFVIIKWDFNYD